MGMMRVLASAPTRAPTVMAPRLMVRRRGPCETGDPRGDAAPPVAWLGRGRDKALAPPRLLLPVLLRAAQPSNQPAGPSRRSAARGSLARPGPSGHPGRGLWPAAG